MHHARQLRHEATVADLIAAPVIAVAPHAPLDDARALLAESRVPAVAVIADGALLGLVTRTDVLRGSGTVADAMTGFVFALTAGATVERAARLMAYEGVGVVAVIDDDGGLLGLVSAADLVRHYAG